MVTINNYDEFAAYLGKNLGVSDYVELSQERINLFADATLDHQWIHVDTERAAVESPYKTTIAHGYLTLSMLPYLWELQKIKWLMCALLPLPTRICKRLFGKDDSEATCIIDFTKRLLRFHGCGIARKILCH